MKFYKYLYTNLMVMSSLIAISSVSWLITWIALEINLLSFLPLMKTPNNKLSAESAIKYFIIQAMASATLLFSIIMFINLKKYSIEFSITISILISSMLMLKIGAAPFHFWFPEIISGLNWFASSILLTWQKIAPSILLIYSMKMPMFFSITIIFSSMISGLQGINQTCLRKIMAYSSINHVSWMLAALLNSFSNWVCYFLIYCTINFNIIFILNKYKIFYINQLNNLFSSNKKIKFFFMMNFLSLGGLPPFLGFFPKWMTVNHLIFNNYYILTITLIIFTLLTIYFYTRITFSSFSLNWENSLNQKFSKMNYFHFYFNTFALSGLLMCFVFMNMY